MEKDKEQRPVMSGRNIFLQEWGSGSVCFPCTTYLAVDTRYAKSNREHGLVVSQT